MELYQILVHMSSTIFVCIVTMLWPRLFTSFQNFQKLYVWGGL